MTMIEPDPVTTTPPAFVETYGAHTDEQRELMLAGVVKPGHKSLDVPVTSMTDSEKLSECVIHARNLRDGLEGLIVGMEKSPVMKMLNGGGGPFGALFGNKG